MLNRNRTSYAIAIALAATLAVVGCKKKDDTAATDTTPPPADTSTPPADTMPPADTTPAPDATAPTSSFVVGNAAAADKSVTPASTFAAKDKIIVSLKTDASTPANADVDAKLTFQDGQVAGDQKTTIKAEDSGTTNVTFSNNKPWPTGTYKVDVTVNGQPVGTTQQIEVK